MALPNYVQQARPNMTAQRWTNLSPNRRQVIRQSAQAQVQPAYNPYAGGTIPFAPGTLDSSFFGNQSSPTSTGPYAAPADPNQYQVPAGNYGGNVGGSTDVSGHPFYDPNSSYQTNQRPGSSFGSWDPGSLGYSQYATEENPEGYYFQQLNNMGLGGFDARSQTAQAMYRDYARGYQAAKMKSPNLMFNEYMGGQNILGTLGQMSYEQLGIDDQRYSGRSRWGMRGY